MEKQVINPKPFLEPVYLNEKMVLNCAAYIFKGYSLESEVSDTTETEGSFGGKAGFNFLKKLVSLNLEAGSKRSSTTENRSARRYTVGGLHMSLIDELHNRKMLHAIGPESLGEDLDGIGYVETLAELRPVDFYALIDTLRMAIPIAEKVLTSIVKPLYDQHLELQSSNPGLPSKERVAGQMPPQKDKSSNKSSMKSNLPLERPATMQARSKSC